MIRPKWLFEHEIPQESGMARISSDCAIAPSAASMLIVSSSSSSPSHCSPSRFLSPFTNSTRYLDQSECDQEAWIVPTTDTLPHFAARNTLS